MAKKSLKEKLAAKRKDLKNRQSGGDFFTVKEGVTRMRPLPVGDEEDWAEEVTWFYLGPNIGGIISPQTFGKFCPIMKAYQKLNSSKDPDDRELAKKFKPSKKYMVPHIRYKDERGREVDREAGAKLALLGVKQYEALLDLYLDPEFGDFTNPRKGYDLKYRRTGKGKMDTQYTVDRCDKSRLDSKFAGKTYNPREMCLKLVKPKDELKRLLEEFLSLPPDDEREAPERKSKKKKNRNRDL